MNKKDEAIFQIETILNELKAGKEENTATVALGHKGKIPNPAKSVFKLFFKFWGIRMIAILLLLAIFIAGAIWIFSGSTFKKETTTFVEQVQDLATLATAEAHMKVIIEQEDNMLFGKEINLNIPGTKRELLLVVPATVIAGVDLKGITKEDIKVDEKAKKLEIKLPAATFIQEPSIQMDQVRTFSDEGLFRGEVKWAEGFDLAAEAQTKIEEEAVEFGLLQTAERNAEKVLNEFFGNLDYTVKVTYK
ncbi:DUF4230 domain-containing protein [Fredinandcohnia quinoae]|uniref:DUF4230 domain-containing protein n=1 Tax=Fredinandcohnia quinoae TaxID=2918902 RepID=A0AAW5DYC3_9BACI|nr:DUF4230 domain-containing protein [Fredinandcohnia sp. SECRCQ15]MCH1624329.1 DUF4230 domain-containing protein [Fredinandcohnia sp. SECRCQ15]